MIYKNSNLNNKIIVKTSSNNDCLIGFSKSVYDKCLLEFIGNNNGGYVYLAFSVVFSSVAVVSQLQILKKDAEEYVNAVIENGNIKITGLASYGVYEARAPQGFNLLQL